MRAISLWQPGLISLFKPTGLLLIVLMVSGIVNVQAGSDRRDTMSLKLTSPAFEYQGNIPAEYTCDGKDISPELNWTGIPDEARSLVLIIDDPDAPDPAAPKMTWVHWVLYNLPISSIGLGKGIRDGDLPVGTLQGLNDWKREGYRGPCPPKGRHRYFHKLYALDTVLPDLSRPTKAKVEEAMAGHVVDEAVLMGTYAH
jgi:Raf kinase inhibitor-like YbhB/YbcL family protein